MLRTVGSNLSLNQAMDIIHQPAVSSINPPAPMLEIAAYLCSGHDEPGLPDDTLKLLIRTVIYLDRQRARGDSDLRKRLMQELRAWDRRFDGEETTLEALLDILDERDD